MSAVCAEPAAAGAAGQARERDEATREEVSRQGAAGSGSVPARAVPRLGSAALPLLLVFGLVTLCPASAAAHGDDDGAALALLRRAMVAANTVSYRGTQVDATWTPGGMTTRMIEVRQTGGVARWATVRSSGTSTASTSTSLALRASGGAVDPLRLLAEAYALVPAGRDSVAGRASTEVAVLRHGRVAARLWIDDASGLLLRQEVWDARGRLTRMVSFVELGGVSVPGSGGAPAGAAPGAETAQTAATLGAPDAVPADPAAGDPQAAAARLHSPCPPTLPGGYRLVDARRVTGGGGEQPEQPQRPAAVQALHLTYSDGLSALSVFVQDGRLPTGGPAGMTVQDWNGHRVYVAAGWPARAVWEGGGRVFTAVSDAPRDELADALAALPGQRTGSGMLDRISAIMRAASVLLPGR